MPEPRNRHTHGVGRAAGFGLVYGDRLGAHRRDVFALIMRQGAMQTALAVGAGLLLSLAAGRVLAKILYDVSPSDPLALIIATLMLASAALLACFFPANRATRVNPITALRTE